jgi:hypothetical protein|uniref:Uncharacterized protein n=1 Tax=Podoviridae sp. ctQyH19 TaxID=2825249 RepID=A0A8S5UQN5_9CAUD|nr:MAG TPA: hypothetical protein [Podoviridae sp. ctQyH19]
MDDFKTRLVNEVKELTERTEKLSVFINTPKFNELPLIDREDLLEQLKYMKSYLKVLERRVSRLVDVI